MSAPAPTLNDAERLERAVLAMRQLAYGLADELGRLYGLERPCKVCEQRRRLNRQIESTVRHRNSRSRRTNTN